MIIAQSGSFMKMTAEESGKRFQKNSVRIKVYCRVLEHKEKVIWAADLFVLKAKPVLQFIWMSLKRIRNSSKSFSSVVIISSVLVLPIICEYWSFIELRNIGEQLYYVGTDILPWWTSDFTQWKWDSLSSKHRYRKITTG